MNTSTPRAGACEFNRFANYLFLFVFVFFPGSQQLFAQTLKADYQFNNTKSSSVAGAPDLTDLGGGFNGFLTDNVRGTIQQVLHFPLGNGLRLAPTNGVIPNAAYTIAMLFKIDNGEWRRLLDFKNGTGDQGLYIDDFDTIDFFISGNTSPAGNTRITPNTYVQVVLTRDGAGMVKGYLNGVQEFQFDDASTQLAVIDSNNVLRFFRDNESGGVSNENAAGSVARIRLYDGALNPAQVAALEPTNFLRGAGSIIVSAGSNGTLDPGETVTVSLAVQNTGGPGAICTSAATVATLQATGGVTNPSPVSQDYGALCSNGPAASRDFTFKVDPALPCGSHVAVSLVLKDGTTTYATVTYPFLTGTQVTIFSENFDGVAAPALPAGWVAANASGPPLLWVTSTTSPDTAPNDAYADDPNAASDKRLDTPPVSISSTAASTQVSFRNSYNLRAGFDGAVLEVSSPNINGGAFTDVTDATVGGSFASGGYNGTIQVGAGNPLAGRMAWTGNSGGYIDTVVNLGPNLANQTIKLRFRTGSDNGVGGLAGWRIDSVSITEATCVPGLLVTTVDDHNDGVCNAVDCSLREAIITANAGGVRSIGFAPGVTGTIQLTGALPSLSRSLTIRGSGANLLSVRRNTGGSYRIFNVSSGVNVTLSGLTINNGMAANVDGGGILNSGNLTLNECSANSNTSTNSGAAGGNGGGIYNATGGTLTLFRCTLRSNTVSQFGGAVYNDATFTATNCTFANNNAFRGGAIISRFVNGVSSSTLRNCTIASNTASSTGGGSADGGGGFYAEGGAQQLHVSNTIIARNTNSINPDVRGSYTSDGHNFIGSLGNAVGFANGINGDQVGTNAAPLNPQLGLLGDNGGPTQTLALLNASTAINAGNDTLAPLSDQRRYRRAGVSDIGAFEFDGLPPVPTVLSAVSQKMHGGSATFDIALPLTGPAGVECRTGGAGGTHQVIVTFGSAVSVGGVSVTSTDGLATATRSVSGAVVTIDLSAVANAQTLGITLIGVSDGTDAGDVFVPMGVLLGDTNGNGSVNATDVSQTKLKSGQTVDSSNFRADVTVSNSINSSDVSIVKSKSGTALP